VVEELHELFHEERVALGLPIDRLNKPIVHRTGGQPLHELRYLVLGETAKGEPPKCLLPTQVDKHASEGMAAPQLGIPVGADDQEPGSLEPPGDER